MTKKIIQALIAIFTLSFIFSFLLNYLNAWINVSSSLPYGIYIIESDDLALKKGDLVLSCIPDLYADLAFERGYLMSGKCKNRIAPVGKYIAALEGDEVITTEHGIYINANLVSNSQASKTDGQGREMFVQDIKRKLHKNEIFLLNDKANSFDSRYFGTVDVNFVIGKLKPLAIMK